MNSNTITVHEYEDSMFPELLSYCEQEFSNKEPAASNIWDAEWEYKTHTLPYILAKTTRFKSPTGIFHILRNGDNIVGCAGAYRSNFSDNVALLGCRTWISKAYRANHLVRNYLLPAQRTWAIDNNIDVVALSFNDYNRNIIKIFTKGQALLTRTDENIFYKNLNVLDFPVNIQGVPQWVIYEQLGDNTFDWSIIRDEIFLVDSQAA